MRVSAPSEGTHPSHAIGPAAASGARVLPGVVRQRACVSVVIPTTGRAAPLNACLTALFACELHDADLEIIVVDDSSSAQSFATVQDWVERFLMRGVALRYEASTQPHGPAAARNRGWKAARGHIIAFTDDDTQPQLNWRLVEGVRAIAQGVDAAWGRVTCPILSVRPTTSSRRAASSGQGS